MINDLLYEVDVQPGWGIHKVVSVAQLEKASDGWIPTTDRSSIYTPRWTQTKRLRTSEKSKRCWTNAYCVKRVNKGPTENRWLHAEELGEASAIVTEYEKLLAGRPKPNPSLKPVTELIALQPYAHMEQDGPRRAPPARLLPIAKPGKMLEGERVVSGVAGPVGPSQPPALAHHQVDDVIRDMGTPAALPTSTPKRQPQPPARQSTAEKIDSQIAQKDTSTAKGQSQPPAPQQAAKEIKPQAGLPL